MVFGQQIAKIQKSQKIPHHTARKVLTILYFLATLLGLCVICSVLLSLPFCQITRASILDIIFTSVSAVTLTGASTINIADTWSVTGLTVIMITTQLAGITYTILAAAVAVEIGMRMTHSSQSSNPLLNINTNSKILHKDFFYYAKLVILFVFVIELVGAIAFYIYYAVISPSTTAGNIFASVFNSIIGFCNSGFSLYNSSGVSDIFGLSIPALKNNTTQMLIYAILSFIGGLGFIVLYDLISFKHNRRLSLHTKLVLSTTFIILIIGTATFYIFETSLMHMDSLFTSDKENAFITSIYMPIIARGLGLTSIDLTLLSAPSFFFLAILMFIGDAPGSMASGIKITNVAIIILSILAMLRKKPDIEIFNRRISDEAVRFALTMVMVSALFIIFSVTLVTMAEGGSMTNTLNGADIKSYSQIIFLIISTFANVGLDPNILTTLTMASKIIIIIVMFIGRISSVLFFYVFASSTVKQLRRYPTEPVLQG